MTLCFKGVSAYFHMRSDEWCAGGSANVVCRITTASEVGMSWYSHTGKMYATPWALLFDRCRLESS